MTEPSANASGRILGGGVPPERTTLALGGLRAAPQVASPTAAAFAPADRAGAEPASQPVFLADSSEGADLLGAGEALAPLAHLCVERGAQTPFLAGVVGPAGSGKSFALRRLASAVERLSGGSRPDAAALAHVVVARVDAAAGGDPALAVAAAVYSELDRAAGGVDYSALLDEATHSGGDPLRAAKAAADRHDAAVRRLEAERAARDEAEARSARLGETLLYETPGSRIDAFVRAHRGVIESRLRRFDLAGADSSVAYRDLVRDLSGVGAGSRASVVLRSLWAYPTQARFLFWAIVAFVIAFALDALRGGTVRGWISGLGSAMTPVSDWIGAHDGWFARGVEIFAVLGAAALLLNLWRGFGFSAMLFRGLRYLNADMRERRRDLDANLARLNQRVAALTQEADAASRRAEAAARRAGGKAATRAPGPAFLDESEGPPQAARGFLQEIGRRIAEAASPAPERIVVAIDHLDALPPDSALRYLEGVHSALAPGFAGLIACDAARLAAAAGGDASRLLEKWLQIVVALPQEGTADGGRLLARLLVSGGQKPNAPDETLSAPLADPLSASETALLTALAPLAAHSPRGAKRFLNAYRLARCARGPRPVIALMLAIGLGGDDAARAWVEQRLAGSGDELVDADSPALTSAIRAARVANGGAIALADARAAWRVARGYALSV